MRSKFVGFLAAWALIVSSHRTLQAAGFDWYRWRGPDLNGISKETGWLATWPREGPKRVWKATVGIGFSSVSVANGRVYTLGNIGDKETVYCFDAVSGTRVWSHSYPCELDPHFYEGGPSGTPTVDADRLFTLSRKGDLFCFSAADGRIQWQKNIAAETGAKLPEWGFAGSPLVEGNLLVLNVGSRGTALDKSTGKIVWTTGKEAAGYSTAVPFTLGGTRCAVLMTLQSVAGINLADGKTLWEYPWKTTYDVNAADPVVANDRLFISSGYGRGATLLKLKAGSVSAVWENKNMRNHFNSSLLIGGHIYGMDDNNGSKTGNLRCIDLETGKVKWTEPSVRPGGLMAADGKLIAIAEKGELVIVEASPEGFKPISRAQVIGGKCWTVPVLSNGRIYCRNAEGDLVCVDVRGAPISSPPN